MSRRYAWVFLLIFPLVSCSVSKPDLTTIAQNDAVENNASFCGPISGGIHSRPFNASFTQLRPHYLEEEFFVAGVASNGEYNTRIIVRRPADMEEFNGTVYLEWLNVSANFDLDTNWPIAQKMIQREGAAFIGVSAQQRGVLAPNTGLKEWDPVRYASAESECGALHHPDPPGGLVRPRTEALLGEASFKIFVDVAEALRNNNLVLGGTKAERIIANGQSQSGWGLNVLIRKMADLELPNPFDAMLVQTFWVFDSLARTTVPTIFQISEAETRRAESPLPPDTELLKVWEIAGSNHSNPFMPWFATAIAGRDFADAGLNFYPDGGVCGDYEFSYTQTPKWGVVRSDLVISAALYQLDHWVRSGKSAPTGPRIELDDQGEIVRDELGNSVGGIRLPELEVPIYRHTRCESDSYGLDFVLAVDHLNGESAGTTKNDSWDEPKDLASLYGNSSSYLAAFAKSTDNLVRQGFILDEDGKSHLNRARAQSKRLFSE